MLCTKASQKLSDTIHEYSPRAYKPPPSENTEPGPVSLGKYVDIRCNASFS